MVAPVPTTTPAAQAEPTEVPAASAVEAPTPTEAATVPPSAVPTAEPTEAPTSVPTVTPVPPLPGEPFDFLVPLEGEVVGVIGVAFDDTLFVHQQPGENSPLTGNLANLADDVVGTGEGRLLPASIWWRIEWQGVEGWVGSGFMARIGATIDLTAQAIELNGNAGMSAETMVDLGNQVADLLKSEEPASRVVVSVAPTVGDLGEITLDIVGLGDDALAGYRIHVFGEPEEAGDGFQLKSVEATLLCSRGISEDGLCL